MLNSTPSIRIGIYGPEERGSNEPRSFALWPVGYTGAIKAAEAIPIFLPEKNPDLSWKEILHDIDGVVFAQSLARTPQQQAEEEEMVRLCREHRIPILGVDSGMHVISNTFGGTLYEDLARELPEALQHRHPPERGLRHAINVLPGTRLADLYGEGEVAVNSEHRKGIKRLGRGFRVSATALDGVIEAFETESDDWWVMGVQWRPASTSASGLDIQVFRGLINNCLTRPQEVPIEEVACEAA
jgi:putative glutamine amidotransferase